MGTGWEIFRYAGLAQWQCSGFVNRRSGVRIPHPAPRADARSGIVRHSSEGLGRGAVPVEVCGRDRGLWRCRSRIAIRCRRRLPNGVSLSLRRKADNSNAVKGVHYNRTLHCAQVILVVLARNLLPGSDLDKPATCRRINDRSGDPVCGRDCDDPSHRTAWLRDAAGVAAQWRRG